MYALSLPHHEVLIHAPATRANGWTHPIPLHHHPKATRRLTCTGMPTAERPAKRTHGSQAHPATLKGRGPHRQPQSQQPNPNDSVRLAKSRRAASRFPQRMGGLIVPLSRLPSSKRRRPHTPSVFRVPSPISIAYRTCGKPGHTGSVRLTRPTQLNSSQ